jgi:flagellar hook-associated protein 2
MSTTGINLSGMNLLNGQGVNVSSLVSQLVTAASVPETQWQSQQTSIQTQISDLNILDQSTTTLLSDVNALQDPGGAVTSRNVNSSDSGLVSATATDGTAVGNHTIVVNSLATTSSYYTDEVASANTVLDSGSFSLTVGTGPANTITIDSTDNTLSGLATAINNQNIGVTASVVTDANGARLALVSQSSGVAGDLNITGSLGVTTVNSNNVSTDSTINFNKPVTGANASLTVDGVPVSSATNTVTGAVAGLTLNLNGADKNTTVDISVVPDTSSVVNSVTSFVNDYNTLIGQINQEYTYNSSTNTSGALEGDSTVEMLQSTLLGAMGYAGGGSSAVNTLGDLGITMNDDGTLSLNSTVLTNAATSNYSALQTFLQGDGAGNTGFATSLASQLSSLTDPSEGAFTVDISGYNASISSLQDEINDFQTYITAQQAMWTTQYDNMNVLLQELPSQMEQVQAELGNSNYANTNNG